MSPWLLLLLPCLPTSYTSSTFPCPTNPGERFPPSHRSVHQLRPQDIGILASLGDSITAGTGALASNILEVLDENRGSAYSTGADGDWRSCPSLYNYLRQYNPQLRGGSHGSTRVIEIPFKRLGFGERGLNLSRSGAVTEDLPGMAKTLIKMVKYIFSDPDQIQAIPGWRKQWKLVTILIGNNDQCGKSCISTFQRLGLSRYSGSII